VTPPRRAPPTVRIVGGLLAAIWVAASLATIAHGVVWARLVREGRLLTLREAVAPWRAARDRDARAAR